MEFDSARLDEAVPGNRVAIIRDGQVVADAYPADGIMGVLCRSAVEGDWFFRVYRDDGSFTDYDMRHDELTVTISADAMASFYHIGDERVLDHSPQVLGLQTETRARGA